jgi:hypothetical protein
MTPLRIALLFSVVLPMAGQAQQRRVTVYDELPPELTPKEIIRLDPAQIAFDRQKDLALTADQSRQLDSMAKAYDGRVKSFGKALDTLQNVLNKAHKKVVKQTVDRMRAGPRRRPDSPQDSIERARSDSVEQAETDRDRVKASAARNALNELLLTIKDQYDAEAVATNALLTEAQRSKIEPIFAGALYELTGRMHAAKAR